MKWIFAFIAGFLSVIPLIGANIIWLLASVYLIARDGFWAKTWFLFVGTNLLYYPVDMQLYSAFFMGQVEKQVTLAMSIILGLYAFGPAGIFKGPIIVGISIALKNVYVSRGDEWKKNLAEQTKNTYKSLFNYVKLYLFGSWLYTGW